MKRFIGSCTYAWVDASTGRRRHFFVSNRVVDYADKGREKLGPWGLKHPKFITMDIAFQHVD